MIIDGKNGLDKSALTILEKTTKNEIPIICVINKSDLLSIDEKILLADKIWKTNRIKEIFSLSAKTGKGCNALLDYFFQNTKNRSWSFSPDDITDKDSNFIVSEFVREQLFILLEKEIPYMLSCETEVFKKENGYIEISVLVNVGKENHKKIILGKHGDNLKKIIRNASKNIEKLLQEKIKLKLFIKTNK